MLFEDKFKFLDNMDKAEVEKLSGLSVRALANLEEDLARDGMDTYLVELAVKAKRIKFFK